MAQRKPVKASLRATKIVGVIASAADLRRAARLRKPPELFELRLDALTPLRAEERALISKLAAPLIITARAPAEGGRNDLPLATRTALLLEFLPRARYLDLELASIAAHKAVRARAKKLGVKLILSFHDFKTTPAPEQLLRLWRKAQRFRPHIVKIVTRTETPAQLKRLGDFAAATERRAQLAVMGTGRCGRASRWQALAQRTPLCYAHFGRAVVSGQLSLAEIRRARASLPPPARV